MKKFNLHLDDRYFNDLKKQYKILYPKKIINKYKFILKRLNFKYSLFFSILLDRLF